MTSNPSISTMSENLTAATLIQATSATPATTEDSNGGIRSTSQVYTQASSSDSTHSMTTTIVSSTPVSINSESEIRSSVSTTTVTALAGIIGLLLILLMGLCGFFLSFYIYTRKRQQSLLEAPQYQDVNNLATVITSHDEQNSIPMFTNSCYQKCSSLLVQKLSDPPTISGQYDDIDIHYYDVIPEDIKPNCGKERFAIINDNEKSASQCTLPSENEHLDPPLSP